MVEVLKEKFADLNLTYSIGGQISFDVFPQVSVKRRPYQSRVRQRVQWGRVEVVRYQCIVNTACEARV